jgi:hypothetical protein
MAGLRIAITLYAIWRAEGLEAFGLDRPNWGAAPKAIIAALGACAVAAPLALLFSKLGISNPLIAALNSTKRSGISLIPFFVGSSMATGYAEELFYRSYLMRRLGQAGLSPFGAALSSSVLFCAGHASQGIIGIVTALAIGLWLSWRWHKTSDIHGIAIGHGLYDSAIWALTLYS